MKASVNSSSFLSLVAPSFLILLAIAVAVSGASSSSSSSPPSSPSNVRFLYNDGFSFVEVNIMLRARQDKSYGLIAEGSLYIEIADIYAAQILDGPDGVVCRFRAESPNFQGQLRTVGYPVFKSDEIENYTSPPLGVTRILCFVMGKNYRPGEPLGLYDVLPRDQYGGGLMPTLTMTEPFLPSQSP